MCILKVVLYTAGALAVGATGIYAGWELNEKYSEKSIPATDDNSDDDDGGPMRPSDSPIPPSSDIGNPFTDRGMGGEDLDALNAINVRDEITNIIKKTSPQVTEAEAFM